VEEAAELPEEEWQAVEPLKTVLARVGRGQGTDARAAPAGEEEEES
jgi:hypothetical protein